MKKMNGADLLASLEWRNATKKFDNTKKVDAETWSALEKALILTPSSYGVMPYKFIVVQTQSIKNELMAVSWNQSQVGDCSHHVVFLAKEKMNYEHIKKYIEQIASVRGIKPEDLAGFENMMKKGLVDNMSAEQSFNWATNQAYIALGNFMTAAAVLGVDACPLEGITPAKYDEILGMTDSGYRTVCACPVGYRAADDNYAGLKKVRFDARDLIIHK